MQVQDGQSDGHSWGRQGGQAVGPYHWCPQSLPQGQPHAFQSLVVLCGPLLSSAAFSCAAFSQVPWQKSMLSWIVAEVCQMYQSDQNPASVVAIFKYVMSERPWAALLWAIETGQDSDGRSTRQPLMVHCHWFLPLSPSCQCESWGWTQKLDSTLLRTWVGVQGMLDTVLEVSWTADQRHLVAAGGDQALRMWDIDSGRVRHTLTGHTGKVLACLPATTCLLAAFASAKQHTDFFCQCALNMCSAYDSCDAS